jgi:hypothetical protein
MRAAARHGMSESAQITFQVVIDESIAALMVNKMQNAHGANVYEVHNTGLTLHANRNPSPPYDV